MRVSTPSLGCTSLRAPDGACGILLLALLAGCPSVPDDDTDTGDGHDTDDTDDGGEAFAVVGFNLESGDSDAESLATAVGAVAGESLWGLAEVSGSSLMERLAEAAADPGAPAFEGRLGTTGYELRLAILWDPERWEVLDSEELDDINVGGTARAPLVAHLRSLGTGRELLFMVNHLWRSEDGYRREQAALLHDWVLEQDLPVVAVGDYNFDWVVEGGEADHDPGYNEMVADGAWAWIRPDPLLATQCSDYYEASVLDFTFAGGEAQTWPATAEILEPAGTYCNDPDESDHRPVRADLEIAP